MKRRKSARSFVPQVDATEYSEAHHASIALLDGFFARILEQEQMYVAAGFPADGLTEFLSKWWTAWEQRSVEQLRALVTDDLVYADPTSGSIDYVGTQTELWDFYYILFQTVPDLAFWPQDATKKALPYYDFLDGEVRITVPWRMIGKAKLTPRTMNVVGVDRYNMVRDPERGWLIERIDTDGDLLLTFGQMMPLRLPGLSQNGARRLVKSLKAISPKLRGPQVRPMIHD